MAKTTSKPHKQITGRALLDSVAGKREYQLVDLTDVGLEGAVKVRSLTGGEWSDYNAGLIETTFDGEGGQLAKLNREGQQAKLVCLGLCNEDESRMYQDDEIEKVEAFPAKVLQKLYLAIRALCDNTKPMAERSENLKETPGDS